MCVFDFVQGYQAMCGIFVFRVYVGVCVLRVVFQGP